MDTPREGGRYVGGGANIPTGTPMDTGRATLMQKLEGIIGSQGEASRPGEPITVRDGRRLPTQLGASSFDVKSADGDPGRVQMFFYDPTRGESPNQPAFTVVLGPSSISVMNGTKSAPAAPQFLALMSGWASA
jgi:hypothetical protein